MKVAAWFFDPNTAKFPLSVDYEWNLVRRAANWVPFLLLAPAVLALLRKLVFPDQRMLIAPSVACEWRSNYPHLCHLKIPQF